MFSWKTILNETTGKEIKSRNVFIENNDNRNAFQRDLDRICFWSSLRRLQDKAQVFPLEEGDFSRTRLTHSIEVMSVAQTLGESLIQIIVNKEHEPYKDGVINPIQEQYKSALGNLKLNPNDEDLRRKVKTLKLLIEEVDNSYSIQNYYKWINLDFYSYIKNIPLILQSASLLHDLGNPPFGHISESLISDWFNRNLKKFIIIEKENNSFELVRDNDLLPNDEKINHTKLCDYLPEEGFDDLTNFDGNAELLRIVTKLQNISPDSIDNPVQISYPTLAATMKYPKAYVAEKYGKDSKKRNFFLNEKELYNNIQSNLHLSDNRHPLAFLLEAADDIAYLSSDLEDALSKKLISKDLIVEVLKHASSPDIKYFKENDLLDDSFSDEDLRKAKLSKLRDAVLSFVKDSNDNNAYKRICSRIKGYLISRVKDELTDRYDEIMGGTYYKNLLDGSTANVLSKIIRSLFVKYVYYSSDVVEKKAEAIKAINLLLDKMVPSILNAYSKYKNNKPCDSDDYIITKLISPNFLELCFKRLEKENDNKNIVYELLFLVVDYISGMTDSFALKTAKLLS